MNPMKPKNQPRLKSPICWESDSVTPHNDSNFKDLSSTESEDDLEDNEDHGTIIDNGSKMGRFWQKDQFLKVDNDVAMKKGELNRGKVKLLQKEKVAALVKKLKDCKTQEEARQIYNSRSKVEFADASNMRFWQKNKFKCGSKLYDQLLKNKFLKVAMKKRKKVNLLHEQKVAALVKKLKDCKTQEEALQVYKSTSGYKFEDGSKMGRFWQNNKYKCEHKPYDQLLKNKFLKADYELAMKKRQVKLLHEEKVAALIKQLKDCKTQEEAIQVYKSTSGYKFEDGSKMGPFWQNNKYKCNHKPYDQLLKNKFLKADYEKSITRLKFKTFQFLKNCK
jgi:hypothetical protein